MKRQWSSTHLLRFVMLVGVLCLFVGVFVSLAVVHGALAAAYREMLRRQGTPDQEVND